MSKKGEKETKIGDRYENQRKALGIKSTSYVLFGSDWTESDHESSLLNEVELECAKKILSALKDEERDLVDMYVLITVIRGYDRAKDSFNEMVKAVIAISSWNASKGGFEKEDSDLLPAKGVETVLRDRSYAKGLADLTKIMGHEKFYGMDKKNHPIFASRLADVNCKKLSELMEGPVEGVRTLARLRILMNEMSRVVKRRISTKSKKYVQKQVNIIDLKGFGMSHYRVKNALQATTRIGEAYYPDSVHRVYLVNTPFIFRAFFAIVKRFLHPITQSKIMCLSGVKSAAKKMKELDGIELSDLPKWMGGTNEGRCLVEMSLKEISDYESRDSSTSSNGTTTTKEDE